MRLKKKLSFHFFAEIKRFLTTFLSSKHKGVFMSNRRTLSQEEADRLLNMIKHSLEKQITFPSRGDSIEFDLVGDSDRDLFTARIFHGKINPKKYNLGARIKKDGIVLLELHINPSNKHYNPDGQIITGSHWHIYTEKYGRSYAFPAEDIHSEYFVENTILFLQKFNVIETPEILYQRELM